MEPRHLRSLRSPALSSIRSNNLLVFHQTLHSKLSRCEYIGVLVCSIDIRILLRDFQSIQSAIIIALHSLLILLPRFLLPRFPALMFRAENSTPAISTPANLASPFSILRLVTVSVSVNRLVMPRGICRKWEAVNSPIIGSSLISCWLENLQSQPRKTNCTEANKNCIRYNETQCNR